MTKRADKANERLNRNVTTPNISAKVEQRRAAYVRRREQAASSGKIYESRQKLRVHDHGGQLVGHHHRWVNDYSGNIESMLDRGYSPVLKEGIEIGDHTLDYQSGKGSWVSAYVGKRDDSGQPLYAYLMKIPEQWYREDEAEIAKRRDDAERDIYGQNFERNLNLKNMRHMPREAMQLFQPDANGVYTRPDISRMQHLPIGERLRDG